MNNGFTVTFDEKAFLLLIPVLFLLWVFFKWSEQFKKPALLFPDLDLIPSLPNFKTKIAYLPDYLLKLAFFLLLIAFIDPHGFFLKKTSFQEAPKEGIAIYILTDESGSMLEEISAKMPNGRYEKISKINFLKQVTVPFIDARKNDLIGLLSFARSADIKAPLTLDHKSVIDEINLLNPSILQSDAGTAIGYAVYKTVNLILATKHFANDLIKTGKPAYEIKNAIIILITDGVQNVNPEDSGDVFRSMDISEAAKYAKENDVRLYIINVDPSILTSKFAPERKLMQQVTKETGGEFYVADNNYSLSDIFLTIDALQKSAIKEIPKNERPKNYKRLSLYPFFIAAAMVCLMLSIFLKTIFLRKIL
ncbi:MAG TPA: VWA domain-containing protein [Parachlamydiaceae bacterium]|nr:VWA domain-containing protein [Parachlamydiaceae bacterium]